MTTRFKKYQLFTYGLLKTIRFNLYYFPFKTALKLPVLLTHKVSLKKLGGSVKLICEPRRGMVTIGYQDVSISNTGERSIWNVEGEVIFKGNAGFGAGTKIAVGKVARLTFGNNFLITAKSEIACFKEITFGDNCLLSWSILVMDTDAHPIYDVKNKRINENEPIKVGNHVWIGCRSLILKGTEIADDCIIAAQSVLNRKYFETNCVIAGQTAKVVKWNIYW